MVGWAGWLAGLAGPVGWLVGLAGGWLVGWVGKIGFDGCHVGNCIVIVVFWIRIVSLSIS